MGLPEAISSEISRIVEMATQA